VEDSGKLLSGKENRKWWLEMLVGLKSFIRIFLGIVWLIDGYLKFSPRLVDSFPTLLGVPVMANRLGFNPGSTFWSSVTASNAALFVLRDWCVGDRSWPSPSPGFHAQDCLLWGNNFSLFIWAIPEGFGGPYGPSSTDIGTGIIYSFVFLSLIIIKHHLWSSKYSLDFLVERKYRFWKRLLNSDRA